MNDNKCYRCGKNQCSGEYRAQSTTLVKSNVEKNLGFANPQKRDIRCCVRCISAKSRAPLHKAEVFVRPENMFLNYIVDKLDKIMETDKTFNAVEITNLNPDKVDKYDLLVSKGSKYILVEVDERQHFKKKQFFEDRKREKRFWTKYGAGNAVIRIRVGDETTYSCISREGGSGGGCSVENKKMFESNMKSIVKHIVDYFNGSGVVHHAYIEFFNTLGIQDFKKTFEYKAKAKPEAQYVFTAFPNDLIENMSKIKISQDAGSGSSTKQKCSVKDCPTNTKSGGKCSKCAKKK